MQLSREIMLVALKRLSEILAEHDEWAVIDVYGGGAIALQFVDTRVTQDIDIILKQSNMKNAVFLERIRQVGDELDLGNDWLNWEVGAVLSDAVRNAEKFVFGTGRGLTVRLATAEQLLACKLFAARFKKDTEDAVMLAIKLNLSKVEDLQEILYKYFSRESVERQNKRRGQSETIAEFIEVVAKKLWGEKDV